MFSVAICKTCQFAVVANEVVTHLRTRHRSLPAARREEVAQAVRAYPGVIQNQEGIAALQLPEPTSKPIQYLAAPEHDGLECTTCGYVCRQQQVMHRHCRDQHGWVNDWKKGGSVRRKAAEPRNIPWKKGISCQRFFPSRAGRRWFRVSQAKDVDGGTQTQSTRNPAHDIIQRIRQEQAERVSTSEDDVIHSVSSKLDANSWVDHVGWAKHLEGRSMMKLRETTEPVTEEEEVLQAIWTITERVLEQARKTSTATIVGNAALFEVQRNEVHVKPRRPFDNRLEDQTWERYKGVWRKLVGIWHRTQGMPDDERPPYRLTARQGELWDHFEEVVQGEGALEVGEAEDRPTEAERAGLEMLVSILDHPIRRGDYENMLISALAVMGISEDGGWVKVNDYTTIYSAVVKVSRMLVVYQSAVERMDAVAERAKEIGKEAAEDGVRSIFQYVRSKVQRFMTRTSGAPEAEPTPMDWILEMRTMGLKIQYDTPIRGHVDWIKDEILFRRARFGMGQLSDMMHGLVQEAREMLAELTMTGEGEKPRQALPAIPWASVEDDHSEQRPGYSFLRDERNAWTQEGEGWVFGQIAGSPRLAKRWGVDGGRADNARREVFDPTARRAYEHAFGQFRERLWLLMHMLGGQPGRATELAGIRHSNTANGGVRNVFAHEGSMCFVTAYHKGFRSTGQAKVIHRYLPREVGELLVWYLWLVLPFWQEVQGTVSRSGRYSAYLWADEILLGAGGQQDKEMEQIGSTGTDDGGDDGTDETAAWTWKEERVWTTDRSRRIIQQCSSRLLGSQLNVSMWRHIAIAIANRYLNEAFGRPSEGGPDEDDEADNVDDSPWDLQAGHSTRLAGLVYARLMMQFGSGTAAKQRQFRQISQQWHRFFDFGAEDREAGAGAGSRTGAKRQAEPYDGVRTEARLRRQGRLRQADLEGQLRQMTGAPGATFRGNQAQAVRAIVDGHSPVVQIMGTGGGKSVSFMLPAFCSPDGVTIVVTPLVSLRSDLHVRCNEAGIRSSVWSSRKAPQAAAIVFVTPESVVSKGFHDFVLRLQARQALDRIVLDECHVVLEGNATFRPKLREVGAAVREFGVQTVCLTATLAPGDEAAFFHSMRFDPRRVLLFRSRTTRKNVRYSVVGVESNGEGGEDAVEAKVGEVIVAWLEQLLREGSTGKAIIYADSIERVERLGEMLGCPTFFSSVDSVEGKAVRLETWRQSSGSEGVIVATNALGLGIDVPDVRVVVHAGMPRMLRHFVQESGRAGRDGQPSASVVVRQVGSQGQRGEAVTEEYVEGGECRRIVLDRVMDGRKDRFHCEEGEEACDTCRGRQQAVAASSPASSPGGEAGEGERVERRRRFDRWQLERERMQEGGEVDTFLRELHRVQNTCVLCHGDKDDDGGGGHAFSECPREASGQWGRVRQGIQTMETELLAKRRFEPFSGCFHCGLPQGVCQRWRAEAGDGGRFSLGSGACQFSQVLVAMFVAGMARLPETAGQKIVKDAMDEEGFALEEDEAKAEGALYRWLGGRIRWGGIEASRLCRLTALVWDRAVAEDEWAF